MHSNQVCPEKPLTKARVSAAIAAGWARVAHRLGKGSFADKIEIDPKTVNRALTGETTPELHTAFNALIACPTALDEVVKLYGFQLVPLKRAAANDLSTAAGVIAAMGELVQANSDGHRDHNETLAVATLLRPYLGAINAIVDEADRLKGAQA